VTGSGSHAPGEPADASFRKEYLSSSAKCDKLTVLIGKHALHAPALVVVRMPSRKRRLS
jgi:hypothetical protein